MLTTEATAVVAEVHPKKRMLVMLTRAEQVQRWLDQTITESGPLENLMMPCDEVVYTVCGHVKYGEVCPL